MIFNILFFNLFTVYNVYIILTLSVGISDFSLKWSTSSAIIALFKTGKIILLFWKVDSNDSIYSIGKYINRIGRVSVSVFIINRLAIIMLFRQCSHLCIREIEISSIISGVWCNVLRLMFLWTSYRCFVALQVTLMICTMHIAYAQ